MTNEEIFQYAAQYVVETSMHRPPSDEVSLTDPFALALYGWATRFGTLGDVTKREIAAFIETFRLMHPDAMLYICPGMPAHRSMEIGVGSSEPRPRQVFGRKKGVSGVR